MVSLDLKSVHFVMDANGKQSAVQLGLADWRKIIAYLEELEDRAAVKDMLAALKQGPEQSGALDWQETRKQW